MADAVGAFQVDKLSGTIPIQRTTLIDITRPGVDGVAFRRSGSRSRVGRIRTISGAATSALAKSRQDSYYATVGTVVNLLQGGRTYANYMILDVDVDIRRAITEGMVGGTANYLLFAVWDVQYAGT